eukprot:366026-Chlamydomonas_euryale.AAC.14
MPWNGNGVHVTAAHGLKSFLQAIPAHWNALQATKPPTTPPFASTGHTVFLDDCNFHECANLESFDIDRTITLVPPEGERLQTPVPPACGDGAGCGDAQQGAAGAAAVVRGALGSCLPMQQAVRGRERVRGREGGVGGGGPRVGLKAAWEAWARKAERCGGRVAWRDGACVRREGVPRGCHVAKAVVTVNGSRELQLPGGGSRTQSPYLQAPRTHAPPQKKRCAGSA